jgi:hypothetical protein
VVQATRVRGLRANCGYQIAPLFHHNGHQGHEGKREEDIALRANDLRSSLLVSLVVNSVAGSPVTVPEFQERIQRGGAENAESGSGAQRPATSAMPEMELRFAQTIFSVRSRVFSPQRSQRARRNHEEDIALRADDLRASLVSFVVLVVKAMARACG